MTREMRVKLFLTEYKEICEKYQLHLDAGEVLTEYNHDYSSFELWDDSDAPDIYPVEAAKGYKVLNSRYGAKLSSLVYADGNDKDGTLVTALDSMPEITEDYIGTVKQERSPEEVRKRLADLGINI